LEKFNNEYEKESKKGNNKSIEKLKLFKELIDYHKSNATAPDDTERVDNICDPALTRDQLFAKLTEQMRRLKQAYRLTEGCGSRGDMYTEPIGQHINAIRYRLGINPMTFRKVSDDGAFGTIMGTANLRK
jgi:hypothetical protein